MSYLQSTYSFTDPPPSSTNKKLNYMFKNLSPEELKKRLLLLVETSRRDYAQRALLEALEVLGFDMDNASRAIRSTSELHCARCHNYYWEIDNHPEACRIEHVLGIHIFDDELPNNMGTLYNCCNKVLAPEDRGPCVLARHTNKKGAVVYNGETIKTCKAMRCYQTEEERFLAWDSEDSDTASPVPQSPDDGYATEIDPDVVGL